jgi:tetratricopeptide (TPR) repeat protein
MSRIARRPARFILRFLSFVAVVSVAPNISAQDEVDYNLYYQYPLGIGLELRNTSPLYDNGQDLSGVGATAIARVPLPPWPRIQPYGRIGLINVTVEDPDDLAADRGEERWNHLQYFGILGGGFTERFAQQFEAGGDLGFGFGESLFRDLLTDRDVGERYLFAELAGRLAMSPSYHVGIEFRPVLQYSRSLGELERYNGFSFNLGLSVSYRFGQDPDADGGIIRSIRFDEVQINDVFPAMQSYYVRNPIGSVRFTNQESTEITGVAVSFYQEGFMDTPTAAATFELLAPGETVEVELPAAFNGAVFETEGITPLSGEVIVDYTYRTKGVQQRATVDYDMHDLRALTWDDTRKAAAMVTPADSNLQNFTSFARQATRDDTVGVIPQALQNAMVVFYALKDMGIIYQRDPVIPFDEAQASPTIVDSITLPRNTLQRTTGECDDLTVLYASLLESIAVETGFVATPGHLYNMFNTGVPIANRALVHPDPEMTLEIDGFTWVPVEITLVGQASFMEAWREGANEWRRYADSPEARELVKVREAQLVYRPVALRQSDVPIPYGERAAISTLFNAGLDELVDLILAQYERSAQESGSARDFNQLGIIAGDFRRYGVAERALNTALSLDRNYLPAQINLGNIYLLQERPQNALRQFHRAEQTLVQSRRERSSNYPQILLAISRAYYDLANYDRAQEYFLRLQERDPQSASENRYLGTRGSS